MEERVERYGMARYFLLTMVLSFIGWAYESAFMFVQTGKWHNQGFMTMPFCPIYGCALMATFFIAGTPNALGGMLAKYKNGRGRYALYLLTAFFIPTIAELLVGVFFDKAFSLRLWSYQGLPLSLGGYACVFISCAWAIMIFAFMKWLFPILKEWINRISLGVACGISVPLLLLTIADFCVNFARI